MLAILVVEDDELICNQIEKAINSMGRTVRILKAPNGEKALKILNTMVINILIVDINLPDYDGIEIAKIFHNMYPYHPIIVESSENDSLYIVKVYDQIENLAFLDKPYSMKKLISKVDYALNICDFISTNQLKIKQNGFVRIIDIRDIIYVKKIKGTKKVEIFCYDHEAGHIRSEKFSEVSLLMISDMLIDKKDLLQCHRTYLINPKMIEKVDYTTNSILLKYAAEEIPFGRTYKKVIDWIA